MATNDRGPITQLLAAANRGEPGAVDRLWNAVYDDLRRVARRQLAAECGGNGAMQTTSLVNQAYLRLIGPGPVEWANRRHFFVAAAQAMRRIRIDAARGRKRLKRGAGAAVEALLDEPPDALTLGGDPAEALAIDEALERLAAADARRAEIVLLRYFAGRSVEETAEALGLSPRTVEAEWRFAKAWLHRALSGG